jgi:hypothetical protein
VRDSKKGKKCIAGAERDWKLRETRKAEKGMCDTAGLRSGWEEGEEINRGT